MNTYEIKLSDGYTKTQVGETGAQAKYNLFRYLSDCWDITFGEFLKKVVSCRKLKSFTPSDLFGDKAQFERVIKSRGIDFAYQGMRIEVNGKPGVIVGANRSCNLDVVFDDTYWTDNCHPWWRTKYYDKSGKVIEDYYE